MAVLLSLLTSAMFGTGDFCGGLAAKRADLLQVVGGAHLVGLIGAAVAAVFVADQFTVESALLGAGGGVFGAIGVALLYRRLALGPMAVVAPLTAITSAALPAMWGVATGDEVSGLVWVGVVLALVAIGLVSSTESDHTPVQVTPAVILESLLAGAGFGLMFVFFDATDADTAPWPVVSARLLTTTVLVVLVALGARSRGQFTRPDRTGLWLIALVGIFDTSSNVTFLYASDEGSLTVVAVLSSLYPVATVILARVVLAERMTPLQLWGFVAAMVATGLIAAG